MLIAHVLLLPLPVRTQQIPAAPPLHVVSTYSTTVHKNAVTPYTPAQELTAKIYRLPLSAG